LIDNIVLGQPPFDNITVQFCNTFPLDSAIQRESAFAWIAKLGTFAAIKRKYTMATMEKSTKTLHIFLWIAQALLAASLIWASGMKLFQSPEKLAEMWPWTAENPTLVKLTGVLDLLAALGFVLLGLLRIQPKLTIYAAYATIALMVAASIFHITRGEASLIGVNIFFAVLAGFIAWGRSKKAVITARRQ
jgi:hypothetical protein